VYCSLLQCTVVYFSELQSTPVYCSLLQCTAVYSSVLQSTPVYCSLLQCTAGYSSLLQSTNELGTLQPRDRHGRWAERDVCLCRLLHSTALAAATNLKILCLAGNIACNYNLVCTQRTAFHILILQNATQPHDRPGEAPGTPRV
jgi:hypothetical protein